MPGCVFCEVVGGLTPAHVVSSTAHTLAFLDVRPLFPGHVLVVPRGHHETLPDLPAALLEPLFAEVQRIARALPIALAAHGTFVALNNRVSQSVPHVHVHVVPRTKGDGLKGFFWPRRGYASAEAIAEVARAISGALSATC